MLMSAHKILFSMIVLTTLLGIGWMLIVYVLSFHAARQVIDKIDDGHVPRRSLAYSRRRLVSRNSRPRFFPG